MPTILTQIIEGPREEDGRVRFHCDTCGNDTNWILPPEEGHQTIHYCDHSPKALARVAGNSEPCAENYLNAAKTNLEGAKRKSITPELIGRIEALLEEWPEMTRMAIAETLQQR